MARTFKTHRAVCRWVELPEAWYALSLLSDGWVTVEPDGAGHSRIVYTFIYDQEPLGTADAKAASRKQRTDRFTAALAKMKAMAEAP